MKLLVGVVEARNLPAMDAHGLSNAYAKVQLGKHKFKTKAVKKCLNPSWGEKFCFHVDDLNEDLLISVLDEDKYFNDDFVGQLRLPVSQIFDADNQSLGTAWYSLLPKNKKSKNKDCGEMLLNISFSHDKSCVENSNENQQLHSRKHGDLTTEKPLGSLSMSSLTAVAENAVCKDDKSSSQKTFAGRIAQIFNRNPESSISSAVSIRANESSEQPEIGDSENPERNSEDQSASVSFEEAMRIMASKDQASDIPSNLPGGVLLDQLYVIPPAELNSLIFSPASDFPKSLAEMQGVTDYQAEPWKFENGWDTLKRILTYVKAATKLIKATRATEEHTYLKADGKMFAVLAVASTPDVPCGSCFKIELLYCITPGPELLSGSQSSQLVISWRVNFVQSTMMKGFIENGARQGLKDGFEQFLNCLAQNAKPVNSKDLGSEKEKVLASLQAEPQSDWKLAVQYFAKFSVFFTTSLSLYILVHIWLATPNRIQGLEFTGLDLPDSTGEVIVSGILVLQGEWLLGLISRFIQARAQRGSGDHGIKAQGDGWLLTVALIEGSNLAAVDSGGFSDPYLVFTCNGKCRTSSIKFQTCDPLWNEIFEFDAMDDPPSVLDVEVFDFDGLFDEPTSLGHAEINFVKTNISNLTDIWIPLEGKLAQACQSKLHLRIFLNNTRGGNVVKEYLTKMEKEVGKKLTLRSPQTNSAFQKLFGLPPEEFLINDFTCHLKRRMPLQGRLFLSARIIGFHANLFGCKTKFFFLWEDIEDIQIVPPTLASMGSPVILMTLWPGRGLDARHGAKTQDEQGRLKFYFYYFVSFNIAQRTLMALWRARSLSPEQKVQIVEEESEAKNTEESESYLGLEDVSMSEVYSSMLSAPVAFTMEMFSGGDLDRRVMEKVGCLNYSFTPWELVKNDAYERQIYYRFDRRISRFRGEVTSTQQKSPLPARNGWVIEEVMTLHGIPIGENFNLHLKYQMEDPSSKSRGCHMQVFFGIEWLKSTRHQKRVAKNIVSNLQDRLKEIFSLVEKEFPTS